ncbi:MAG: hypothetical protein J6A15_09460 [Clostridia bacterium]|nr:hypothetical protein [Clostridia bacterium]
MNDTEKSELGYQVTKGLHQKDAEVIEEGKKSMYVHIEREKFKNAEKKRAEKSKTKTDKEVEKEEKLAGEDDLII